MKRVAGSLFSHTTLELAVVPVVRGILDFEVVATQLRFILQTENMNNVSYNVH